MVLVYPKCKLIEYTHVPALAKGFFLVPILERHTELRLKFYNKKYMVVNLVFFIIMLLVSSVFACIT